jgi:hypothetical protein
MKVVFSIQEGSAGQWSVLRGSVTLFRQLRFAVAIKLAREVAYDEHRRSGGAVTVEMPGPTSVIQLASYARHPAAA